MPEKTLHSHEFGRRGKPDKLDAIISHLIGAYFLALDRDARFNVRVSGGYSPAYDRIIVSVSGEVSEHLLRIQDIRKKIVTLVEFKYIELFKEDPNFSDYARNLTLDFSRLKPQSHDLALNHKAGDSGNPIAVAYRYGPDFLPWERFIACDLGNLVDSIYLNGLVHQAIAERSGVKRLNGLLADGKVIVDAFYDGANLDSIDAITLHVQHHEKLRIEYLRKQLGKIVQAYLDNLQDEMKAHPSPIGVVNLGKPTIEINGLGAWNKGGWIVDEGHTEAKPHFDAFGSYGVGEDSPWGEDPSKPSVTGPITARYVGVNVVAHDLADFARVSLRYNIGREEVGLNVTTNGTAKVSQHEIHKWVRENFPLSIGEAVQLFDLKNSELYKKLVNGADFFHSCTDRATNTYGFPWNVPRTENLSYINPFAPQK